MFVDTYFGEARLLIPESFLVEIRKNRGIIQKSKALVILIQILSRLFLCYKFLSKYDQIIYS